MSNTNTGLLIAIIAVIIIGGAILISVQNREVENGVNENRNENTENVNTNNDLGTIERTTSLNISGQNLTRVPDDVFENRDLVELDVSNNQIGNTLQAEVRNLTALRVLDLSDNEFTGVPAEIGLLSQLEVLDLSNNNLTGLPHELGKLSNLRTLDLRGNAYSETDLAAIEASLSSTTVVVVD